MKSEAHRFAVEGGDATPHASREQAEGVRAKCVNPNGDNLVVREGKEAALRVLWRVLSPARGMTERSVVAMLRVSRTWWRDRVDRSMLHRHPAPLGVLFQFDEQTFEDFVREAREERVRMREAAKVHP